MKPNHSTHASTEGDQKHEVNKELDREIRNMVNAITGHISNRATAGLSSLHSFHDDENDDDDHGVRIITLAGSNNGATMRSEFDDKLHPRPNGGDSLCDDDEPLSTYVNSNFQAVNNSIMLGSSYSTSDPGVHLDITDVYEPHGHDHKTDNPLKHAKKEKQKADDKKSFKSDHHSHHSD